MKKWNWGTLRNVIVLNFANVSTQLCLHQRPFDSNEDTVVSKLTLVMTQ